MSDEKIVEKPFSPGLAGVVGAETAVGYVDGAAGRLLYRGYPIEEVVTQGSYAGVLDLLLTGEWHPTAELVPEKVPPAVLAALRLLPAHAHPMDALRTAISVWGRVSDLAGHQPPTRRSASLHSHHLRSPHLPDCAKGWSQLIRSQGSESPRHSCSSSTTKSLIRQPPARLMRI